MALAFLFFRQAKGGSRQTGDWRTAMPFWRFVWNNRGFFVCAVDVAALALFWQLIPGLARPLDVLFLLLTFLGIFTAVFVRWQWLRSAIILVCALSLTLFALELIQGATNVFNMFEKSEESRIGQSGAYGWDRHDGKSYLAARTRFATDHPDLEVPPLLAADATPAGDIAGYSYGEKRRDGDMAVLLDAEKPPYSEALPLGWDLVADNRVRYARFLNSDDLFLYRGTATVGDDGVRRSPGSGGSDAVYLFLGGGDAFGQGLADEATLPSYFSQAAGGQALNLAVPGAGPNHALRDLEINLSGRSLGLAPETVKGVYYILTDDDVEKAVKPLTAGSPDYILENGRPTYQGPYREDGAASRWSLLWERSRIYPLVRERMRAGRSPFDVFYKWDLTLGMLGEMQEIVQRRYNVPLTVIYWDPNITVGPRLAGKGIEFVSVDQAFGNDWRRQALQYQLVDGLPTAFANAKLAEYLAKRLERETQQLTTNL